MGEDAQLATVPVMLLTSSLDPHVFNRVAPFPISGYHLKPLAPNRLATRLRTLIDHPRPRCTGADQAGRLICSIAKRTGNRVRNLCVETVDGRVVVRGRSDSYHVKQLVVAALREVLEDAESPSERIEMDIEVG